MIYTLSGSNNFGLRRRLNEVKESFVSQYGDFGLEQLDGEESSMERMLEAIQSLPFLAEKKLVILMTPSTQKTFTDDIESIAAAVPDET